MLYEYLLKTYGENEPIILSDVMKKINMSENNIRQQIKKMTDTGQIKRYDTGIYFIPKKTMFKSGSQLSMRRVIEEKYLKEDSKRCGYISGVTFANQLGITTQVGMVYEIVTNKATNDYRELTLANSRIVVRKPRTKVNEENYRMLQFLDLIKDIDYLAESSGEELKQRLLNYMNANSIKFSELEKYLTYYPDRIYKNLFEARLLYGVSS